MQFLHDKVLESARKEMTGKHLAKTTKKRKLNMWSLAVGLLMVMALAVLLFSCGGPKEPELPDVKETIAPEKENPSIAIPGYEYLSLAAGTKTQSIALNNPETNTCYFLISLRLEDGTELWQSEYLAPGEVSEVMELNQKLEPGTYNAVLHYDCFRMNQELSPLNGAETKLTLRVK